MTHYEEWTLPTPDGKVIFGATDYANENEKSDKVLVIVHGLTGHMNEYHIKGAANYFSANGYDVIRFNLYPGGEGRILRETTLQTYASDLNHVLKHKALNYKKSFIAGHSYGGPTIMIAQPNQATALSLWDPTFDFPKSYEMGVMNIKEQNGLYISERGIEILIGEELLKERKSRYAHDECLELSKTLSHVPIQVIAADECYGKDEFSWHNAGHPKNHRQIISNCDHCFSKGKTFDEVLKLSHQWFEKF